MDSWNEILKIAVPALLTFGLGWLTRRPTKVDKDAASWKRLESVVETLQEEVKTAKEGTNQLHQDLVASEKDRRQLHEDLLSTKSQLIEMKGLLQEAISVLKSAGVDIRTLENKINKLQEKV